MDGEARPRLFRELDARGKALRVAAALFLALHLTAMFVGGSVEEVRAAFRPYIGFYANGLMMTNEWGMFGKPPTSTNVRIEAVRADGSTVELASTDAHGRSLFERVRDERFRKFAERLADRQRSTLADPTLAYFCREARAKLPDRLVQVRAVNILHELRDDDGYVTRRASTELLAIHPCRTDAP